MPRSNPADSSIVKFGEHLVQANVDQPEYYGFCTEPFFNDNRQFLQDAIAEFNVIARGCTNLKEIDGSRLDWNYIYYCFRESEDIDVSSAPQLQVFHGYLTAFAKFDRQRNYANEQNNQNAILLAQKCEERISSCGTLYELIGLYDEYRGKIDTIFRNHDPETVNRFAQQGGSADIARGLMGQGGAKCFYERLHNIGNARTDHNLEFATLDSRHGTDSKNIAKGIRGGNNIAVEINENGVHFVCAYYDAASRRLYMYNSNSAQISNNTRKNLFRHFEGVDGLRVIDLSSNNPVQKDGVSCGVHASLMIALLNQINNIDKYESHEIHEAYRHAYGRLSAITGDIRDVFLNVTGGRHIGGDGDRYVKEDISGCAAKVVHAVNEAVEHLSRGDYKNRRPVPRQRNAQPSVAGHSISPERPKHSTSAATMPAPKRSTVPAPAATEPRKEVVVEGPKIKPGNKPEKKKGRPPHAPLAINAKAEGKPEVKKDKHDHKKEGHAKDKGQGDAQHPLSAQEKKALKEEIKAKEFELLDQYHFLKYGNATKRVPKRDSHDLVYSTKRMDQSAGLTAGGAAIVIFAPIVAIVMLALAHNRLRKKEDPETIPTTLVPDEDKRAEYERLKEETKDAQASGQRVNKDYLKNLKKELGSGDKPATQFDPEMVKQIMAAKAKASPAA